jgi:hypothetical protein
MMRCQVQCALDVDTGMRWRTSRALENHPLDLCDAEGVHGAKTATGLGERGTGVNGVEERVEGVG